MKKFALLIFSMLLMGIVSTMSSCEDDGESLDAPGLTVMVGGQSISNGATVSASAGATLEVKIEATEKVDGASPKSFTWQAIANNEEVSASTDDIDIDNNSPVTIDVPFNSDGNDQAVTIKLLDDEDQTVTFAFTITAS